MSEPALCPACGAPVNDHVQRITRRILARLAEKQRDGLISVYGGDPPEFLCERCFLTTVSALNGVTA
jgi:DNA-directed RNA polymerase subunit N (RpoN/RPB10)